MNTDLLPPEERAKIDVHIGRDIGYNPYEIYSTDWKKYRELFLELKKKLDRARKTAL